MEHQYLFKGQMSLSSPMTYEGSTSSELTYLIWGQEHTWAQSTGPILYGPLSPSTLLCYMDRVAIVCGDKNKIGMK